MLGRHKYSALRPLAAYLRQSGAIISVRRTYDRASELQIPKSRRAEYTHYNPAEAGFVEEPFHWSHSSAKDYSETRKGRIKLLFL